MRRHSRGDDVRTPFVRFAAGGSSNLGGEPGEECECGHAQAHVTMPSMPGARFAVVEPQFLFGALEAFLNGPAQPRGTGQLGQFRAARGEYEIVGRGRADRADCDG